MIAAGIVVADQRHNALGKTQRDLQRHHTDLLGDAHGRHRVRPILGGEIVQDRHTRHIQQILDGSGNPHAADAQDNGLVPAQHPGIHAHIGAFPLHIQQYKEIGAGGTIGQKGGQSGPRRTHAKPPGHDKYRIQHNVQQASAHGADAGVERGSLGAHQIGQHHIEDGRNRTAGHRPQHISRRGRRGGLIRPQQYQQRPLAQGTEHRKQSPAEKGTVKPHGRTPAHHIIFPAPQGTAHHTGSSHPKQIVYRIECQQHRGRQRHRRILQRIIQHPHKIRIRQIVQHHHQTAQNGGNRQICHCLGNGHGFKQKSFVGRLCLHFNRLSY